MWSAAIRTTAEGVPEIVVSRHDTHYFVDTVGIVTAIVSLDGELVSQTPAEGIHPLDAELIVEENILPRLGQLRGRPHLHGSAVEISGAAVGFLGPSGAGKSTMVALMAERGAKLIADDAVDLAPTGLGLMAKASSSMAHLRDGTARAVSSTLGPGSPAADKTAIALPTPTDAVPLRALYVLGPHREAVVIEPIKRRDAIVELTAHLHRLDLQDPRVLARELDFLELLTSHVPVARLSFPRDFDRRAALVDAVLADVEALP